MNNQQINLQILVIVINQKFINVLYVMKYLKMNKKIKKIIKKYVLNVKKKNNNNEKILNYI